MNNLKEEFLDIFSDAREKLHKKILPPKLPCPLSTYRHCSDVEFVDEIVEDIALDEGWFLNLVDFVDSRYFDSYHRSHKGDLLIKAYYNQLNDHLDDLFELMAMELFEEQVRNGVFPKFDETLESSWVRKKGLKSLSNYISSELSFSEKDVALFNKNVEECLNQKLNELSEELEFHITRVKEGKKEVGLQETSEKNLESEVESEDVTVPPNALADEIRQIKLTAIEERMPLHFSEKLLDQIIKGSLEDQFMEAFENYYPFKLSDEEWEDVLFKYIDDNDFTEDRIREARSHYWYPTTRDLYNHIALEKFYGIEHSDEVYCEEDFKYLVSLHELEKRVRIGEFPDLQKEASPPIAEISSFLEELAKDTDDLDYAASSTYPMMHEYLDYSMKQLTNELNRRQELEKESSLSL